MDQRRIDAEEPMSRPQDRRPGTLDVDIGTSGPLDELIARFQVETEKKLAEMRAAHLKEFQDMHTKIAQCQDSVVRTEDRCNRFERLIDDASSAMRAGITEVNTHLRAAVAQTEIARKAAEVFEKLKKSQPDFHKMVQELQVKLGAVRTEQTTTNDRITRLDQRLDEFDIVADNFEETRTTVRGLDPIVKNLNDLSKRVGR
jgi:chromosome segregation ATPase